MDVFLGPVTSVEPSEHAPGRIFFGSVIGVAPLSRQQVVAALVRGGVSSLGSLQIKAEIVIEGWANDSINEMLTFIS